ncbi:MAG TPA: helix-turn-helix domain-containing protein [Candidatus Angelobacter sp.]|nr:helix-turn-helix domain-containing protein [Candidatus Angelobacter sp.]
MKDQLEALVAQMHASGILYSEGVREFKKRFIMNVLQQNQGNQCKAARALAMHRNTLSRTIAELKLDVRQFRRYDKRRPVVRVAKAAPSPQVKQGDPHYNGIHRTIWDTEKQMHACECGWEANSASLAVTHELAGTHPLQPLANSLSKIEPRRAGSGLARGAKVGA